MTGAPSTSQPTDLVAFNEGEEYVVAATGRRLSEIVEKAVSEGVRVDVRRYQAA